MSRALDWFLHRWLKFRASGQPGGAGQSFLHRHRTGVALFATIAAAILLLGGGIFFVYYRTYARMVDQRLGSGSLRTSSVIYAAPRLLVTGQAATVPELVHQLQNAGYTEQTDNSTGHYRVLGDTIEISSGPESYFQPHIVAVQLKEGKVAEIVSRTAGRKTERYG